MNPSPLFVALADHGLIRVGGADAAGFLHNLLTNDIVHLPPDGARQAALCSAKGRMLASFLIWREGPDYLLLLSADILPGILKKLSMYVLRSKVKLTDISSERSLFGVMGATIGPAAPMTTAALQGGAAIRLDADRCVLALPAGATPQEIPPAGRLEDWHLAEIRAGQPRIVAATQEAFTPQMVNYEIAAVGGVSFHKGCYPGQEIVARTQYLGKVKRRMYRVKIESAFPPGADVFTPEAGNQHCGAVVLCAPSPEGDFESLLVVQSSGMAANAVHVGKPDGPLAQPLPLPYAVE
ncbi:MAG: folate-binding protein YgfZ [Sulfuritalea sp.]|nr:folate-binding protein YgfZ [Sulfuritalea sp.]